MNKINFTVADATSVANSTKVSAKFVNQVEEAFLMFPKSVTMRYKQNTLGQLVISLVVTYENGMKQKLEGAADVDLISAILPAMGRIFDGFKTYMEQEHEIETAAEGENLVMELFKQYFASTTQRFVEPDWFSETGKRFRCVTFSPSYNMYVKFCLEATDEVNAMIAEACKPEWMKRREAEGKAKQQVSADTQDAA